VLWMLRKLGQPIVAPNGVEARLDRLHQVTEREPRPRAQTAMLAGESPQVVRSARIVVRNSSRCWAESGFTLSKGGRFPRRSAS
jgi:hypothetical protein